MNPRVEKVSFLFLNAAIVLFFHEDSACGVLVGLNSTGKKTL